MWRFAERFEVDVPEPARISLGEGDTPCEDHEPLAQAMGLDRLWLKREDLNPTGSHKDRGAAFQVSARVAEAQAAGLSGGRLVISSSGNAAIAAAAYAAHTPLKLIAFVAPGTSETSIARIRAYGADVVVSERAISLCEAYAHAHGLVNLRPSTDPLAVIGFMSLGWELCEAATDADAVFVFASSGTSLVAIGRSLDPQPVPSRAASGGGGEWPFGLHAVQGTHAHPIAGHFDARRVPIGVGAAGARGARKTRRLGEAVRLIARSGGTGWIVTDAEAEAARRRLSAAGVAVAIESAAALAAAGRAASEGRVRRAIVILTGTGPNGEARPVVGAPSGSLLRAETLAEVERALDGAP